MTEDKSVETADAVEETAAEAAPAAPAATARTRGRRQVKQGVVVSDKMDKTVVVKVTDTVMHPLYQRYIKQTKKFHAHDASNDCRDGDHVVIVSSRPLSKTKRWRVREILKRAE